MDKKLKNNFYIAISLGIITSGVVTADIPVIIVGVGALLGMLSHRAILYKS